MAIFRKIHTSFWSDSFISDLDKDKKMFYLYLLTNERTTQCGIYEITKRQIAFDLGCSIDTVSKLLKYFVSEKKIKYNEQTNEIAIKNWAKYNGSTSPKVKSCIDKELKTIKDTILIQYIYGIDTSPQEEEEQEQEEEQQEEEEKLFFDINKIYNIYPAKCPFRNVSTGKTKKNKDKIKTLLNDYSVDELETTIKTYIAECVQSKTYLKNFSTFLNNLPDYSQSEQEIKTTPDIPNTMDLDWRYKNLIK